MTGWALSVHLKPWKYNCQTRCKIANQNQNRTRTNNGWVWQATTSARKIWSDSHANTHPASSSHPTGSDKENGGPTSTQKKTPLNAEKIKDLREHFSHLESLVHNGTHGKDNVASTSTQEKMSLKATILDLRNQLNQLEASFYKGMGIDLKENTAPTSAQNQMPLHSNSLVDHLILLASAYGPGDKVRTNL
jgi:hypothetical protein